MTTCRRCSECVDRSHHWMANVQFCDEEAEPSIAAVEFVCKHCDATGNECDECGGNGYEYVAGRDEQDMQECSACSGEGVVMCTTESVAKVAEFNPNALVASMKAAESIIRKMDCEFSRVTSAPILKAPEDMHFRMGYGAAMSDLRHIVSDMFPGVEAGD